jgi:hypothetical protein
LANLKELVAALKASQKDAGGLPIKKAVEKTA